MDPLRVACAGAVVVDRGGRLLLVRRGREPGLGRWSIPGGRVEPGETAAQAAVREVAEETGLTVVVTRRLGVVERPAPGGATYVIEDFATEPVSASAPVRAGDDAAEVRWVTSAELDGVDCVDGLREALRAWGAGPWP